jgi:hypothetical protein
MTTRKVAISVPEETLKRAKAHAKKLKSRGLSAYVSEAIAQRVMSDDLKQLFQELLSESGGPATEDEAARADALLGVKKKRRAA